MHRVIRPLSRPTIAGTTIYVVPGKDRDVIMNYPKAQGLHKRLGLGIVTSWLWAVWLWLWRPLISIVAWYVSGTYVEDYLIASDGFRAFREALPIYILVVILTGGGLIIWANINWVRFSNKERRKPRPDVLPVAQAEHFKLPAEEHNRHLGSNRIEISYNEDGSISKVESSTTKWWYSPN